ncbi:MAG: hypothetical protein ACK4S4_14775 [Pyrinomonadaceae bacterium]
MQKGKRVLPWSIALPAAYLALAIYLLPMFPHGGSDNELTRWATAASLVEKGSFDIGWTAPLVGPNVDTSTIDGRYYSNKAPAPAVIAAPVYALMRIFVGPPDASNIRISWFAMRLVISTLPLLLLAWWLLRNGAGEMPVAALLFATPLFVYGLLLFSHVLAAVAIYFAFRLLFDETRGSPRECAIAGSLCGLAVLSEFPAVFATAVFAVGILVTGTDARLRRILNFVLGGVPFALLLAWYNYALFGSPLSMSYAHESFPQWAEVAGRGAFGIGLPSLANLYLLLLSPSRGLLFTAPVLIVPLIAFARNAELRRSSRMRIALAAAAVTILAISGHGAAHGGWSFGPRYILLAVPLLMEPWFAAGENDRIAPSLLAGILFGVSVSLNVIPALTFPFAPPEFAVPHLQFWAPLIVRENWFVPNLANVMGAANAAWNFVPVIVVLAAVAVLLSAKASRRNAFAAGIAGSVAIAAAAIYIAADKFAGGAEASFRRATIAERYFKPADRLAAFESEARRTGNLPVLDRIRDARMMIADERSFAPDNFPYSSEPLGRSPRAAIRDAATAAARGDIEQAVETLRSAADEFPFARCELMTNAAVVLYTAGQRDAALTELNAAASLADAASGAACQRSLFLLYSLYAEMGESGLAGQTARKFLDNTAGSSDREILELRRQVAAAAR